VGAAAVLLACAVVGAGAATSYPDAEGDVRGGPGADITSVTVSSRRTAVTFRIRFAEAPPLRVGSRGSWVDMLLVGIDVPPLGPPPVRPGGEWRGANFALGMHGPSTTGQMVRLGRMEHGLVARFDVVRRGSTVIFSVPRRALGSPTWFTFTVVAARESAVEPGEAGFDVAPERGTFRWAPTG
jgi:hypothetical protein